MDNLALALTKIMRDAKGFPLGLPIFFANIAIFPNNSADFLQKFNTRHRTNLPLIRLSAYMPIRISI